MGHQGSARKNNNASKIVQHTNTTKHNIDFENVKIMARETNLERRLFLEAWYSIKDPNSGNDYISVPDIYKSLCKQAFYCTCHMQIYIRTFNYLLMKSQIRLETFRGFYLIQGFH